MSVEYFASGEGVIPKSDETLGHLENLELMADNGGWPCGQLQRLLQSVRKIILPANLVRRLLSSLVPKDAVSGHDLAKLCIWALGNSAFSMDCVMLPTLRLVGLCLHYDCCTDLRPLASLYELFFGLLSKDKLTGVVAELLAVITTRDEVTQWRINKTSGLPNFIGPL